MRITASVCLAAALALASVPAFITSRPVHAQTAPATAPATAPSADTAKAEIDKRMEEVRKLFADGKFEEAEKAGNSPDDWKAKLAADPKALEKEVAKDKEHPADSLKSFTEIQDLVKKSKPTLSADGNTATYKLTGENVPPVFVLVKVGGVWYPSESATMKAMGL